MAWLCLTFFAVVCADQASKVILRKRVALNRSIRLGVGVQLHHVGNGGSLFGVRSHAKLLLLLWGVAASCGLLVIGLDRSVGGGAAAGVALAVGGATGNLLDRLVRGYIVDFIRIGFWPIFNLADAGIVGGIAVTIAALLV